MSNVNLKSFNQILVFRWKPNIDLAIVALSWVLVVGALYAATFIIGQEVWGGMGYFLTYALLGATIFGVGLPLYWMVIHRRQPLSAIGLTTKNWTIRIGLQVMFSLIIDIPRLLQAPSISFEQLFPLLSLALTIGFFEAVFWRGWVQLRLEESFGIIPAIILASILYAAYHVGYGMKGEEIFSLFFIGLMFAAVFRLTKSILILWPFFQPLGQLITLINDQLILPMISAVGFIEAFVVMLVLIGLAARYLKKHQDVKEMS
jgi:membrane protease YdiL (CAAX protease family)